ncbi:MAG: phosphoglycerate mutase [Dehalococcoidia bacterium]
MRSSPKGTPFHLPRAMRILLIIFDGLGDRPAPELGGNTPLEAARAPNLDRLAQRGMCGLFHPLAPGYTLGSPLALHLMFGYPQELFPDRGPLLAVARGLEFGYDAVALAARFASVVPEGGRLRLRERFIRGEGEACRALAQAVAEREVDGLSFRYVYCGRGDGILFIAGEASHEVTDTDPLGLDLPVLEAQARADAHLKERAGRTATALNRYLAWACSQLVSHPMSSRGKLPINFIITKWAGKRVRYEPFRERWGLRPASLPDEEVVAGLMQEMRFDTTSLPNEDDPERDLRQRLARAKELLARGYEFIHLHTKHPDPVSHRNDPEGARDAIEALDRGLEHYWRELAPDPHLITVLTGDHTTPSVWAHHPRRQFIDLHGGEPVPIVIAGGNLRVDDVAEFGERPCAHGGLGHLRGADLMPILLDTAERANMYEMRPTPVRRLYRPRPEDVKPFTLPD